jgi:uncharacterized repeat protein (TIGR01451 family)
MSQWAKFTAKLSTAIFAAVFPMALAAGPYDNTSTVPGTIVTNTAEIQYEVLGTPQVISTADSSFVVSPIGPPGTLVAYRWTPDNGDAEQIRFPNSSYSPDGNVDGPFVDLPAPTDFSGRSNTSGLTAPVPGTIPAVPAERIYPGVPVFFVLEDQGLNFNSNQVDFVSVTISDDVTGDEEVLRFYETGPDTGIFTAWVETQNSATSVRGDGSMAVVPLSVITARYEDPFGDERNLIDTVTVGPVDPFGIVFDSSTGVPIDGISVTIVDAATGAPARVYGLDLEAVYPSTVITGSNVTDSSGQTYALEAGEFRFPFVDIGDYRLVIGENDRYTIPSIVSDADLQALPGAPYILIQGSRLETFEVRPGPPVELDIPADRRDIASVTRTANTDQAEVGDFVQYTVTVTPSVAGSVDIIDTLPSGINIEISSLRIDGLPVTSLLDVNGNPVSVVVDADGREFLIDDYPTVPGRPIVITYVTQVGPSALPGSTIPTRTDIEGGRLRTSFDIHDLDILAPFDLDTIAILGDITVGACGAEPETMNLSGIRIFLETGDYAITDANGRFSFRDIDHRDHVVQIDELTLPLGARPILCRVNVRNAGSAISRFVDVERGMLGRAEFRIVFDDLDMMAQADKQVSVPSISDVTDYKGTPNSGVETPGSEAFIQDGGARIIAFDQEWIDTLPQSTPQGMLSPRDGELPARESIQIHALRKDGRSVTVLVNGIAVPAVHRGRSLSSASSNLNVDVWSGVKINEGRNTVEMIISGASGEEVRQSHEVLYATGFDKVEILAESSRLETDGRSTPFVRMKFTTNDGIPMRPGTKVNVSVNEPFRFEPEGGRRRSMDASEKRPSKTTTLTIGQDGTSQLTLSPVLYPDTAIFTIPRGDQRPVVLKARISAAERPWVLVGIAEGSFAERQIRRHMRRPGDLGGEDDDPLRGRIAFFAEGIVKGEWLLTLRYDSAKGDDEDFGGIDPDKDYIVYGDESYQGDASPSRFPLYIRLKREDAEILLGDFNASINTNLLSIDRKVTGLRVEYENENFRIMGFIAETGQRYVVDRIALDGTSGPFVLTAGGLVQNSETVKIITVSRFDATEELEEETLEAGVDYVLDRSRGRIFLRRPISAFTADFDRNILVVDYETDEEIEKGLLVGGRVEVDLSENVTVGASVLRAERLDGTSVDADFIQADIKIKATENLTLSAEALTVKKTDGITEARGQAGEVRLTYLNEGTLVEAYAKTVRGSVDLGASLTGDDVDLFAAEFTTRLTGIGDVEEDGVFLEGAARYERNLTRDEDRSDVEALVSRHVGALTYGVGLGYSTFDGQAGSGKALKLLSSVGWISNDGRFETEVGLAKGLYSEGEAVITDQLSFGATYAFNDKVSVFGTYDIARRAGSNGTQGAATLGVELSPWDGGSITAGLIHAQDGSNSGAAAFIGARQQFDIAEGTILSFGLDAQRDIMGGSLPLGSTIGNPFIKEAFTSGSVGVRKTMETWSAGAELSYSVSDTRKGGALRVSADGELNEFWSIGGEALLGFREEFGIREDELQLRFGAAHRGEDRAPITIFQLEGDFELDGSRKIYASVNHHRYFEKSSLNLRAAAKWQEQGFDGLKFSDTLGFLGGEYRYDISEKFDVGVHGSLMTSSFSGQTSTSYGLSVGVTPFKNGQLNIGYNFNGFRDPDYSASNITDKGLFVEFKVKIDKSTFKDLFR